MAMGIEIYYSELKQLNELKFANEDAAQKAKARIIASCIQKLLLTHLTQQFSVLAIL